MTRWAVLLAALVTTTLVSFPSPALGNESHDVLLLEPDGYKERWLEAEHRVAAELEAAGFRVLRRRIVAEDKQSLMRQLLASEPAFASLALEREGQGGAALVWLSGTARIKRFAMNDVTSSRAAGAIALRVSEYLNMQVLTITVPVPSAASPSSSSERRTAPELEGLPPYDRVPHLRSPELRELGLVWVGPSAFYSSDARSIVPGGSLGVAVSLAGPVSLEMNGDLMPVPFSVDSASGTTKVSGASGRLYGQFAASIAENLRLVLGLGAGVLRVTSSSEAAPGFRAQRADTNASLVAARGRIAWHKNAFNILASFDPAVSIPAISVRSDEREVARLGRPWLNATLAAGWSF